MTDNENGTELLPEQLLFLDPKDIWVPDRLRKEVNESQLKQLTDSISKTGQIHPVRVRPIEDDEGGVGSPPWALVAGYRRLTACKSLGVQVRATNYANMSPFLRTRAELEENLYRQDMTWQEQVDSTALLHELFKREFGDATWTARQTAAVLGETEANMSMKLKVANAMKENPDLRKANSRKAAIRAVDMDASHKARIARLPQAAAHTQTVQSKLFLGDARDYVRTLENGSIDLLFTDPPYGIDYYSKPDGTAAGSASKHSQGGLSKYDDSSDTTRDLLTDLVPQWFRITHSGSWMAVMMNEANYNFLRDLMETCCATHFEYAILDPIDYLPMNKCSGVDENNDTEKCSFLKCEEPHWIWYRSNSNMPSMYPDRHAQNCYERILVLNRGTARLAYPCQNVLDIPNEYGGERWHAMQKPMALCEEIIKRLSLPGERVLDSTFGSGNILKAATKLLRDFRGCEQNPALFNLAIGSISEAFGGDIERLAPEAHDA